MTRQRPTGDGRTRTRHPEGMKKRSEARGGKCEAVSKAGRVIRKVSNGRNRADLYVEIAGINRVIFCLIQERKVFKL